MATQVELEDQVDSTIDITGRGLTFGVHHRALLKAILSAVFGQFKQAYPTQTVTLNAGNSYTAEITIPSATYAGTVKSVTAWKSNGALATDIIILRGESSGDQVVTVIGTKTTANLKVEIDLN